MATTRLMSRSLPSSVVATAPDVSNAYKALMTPADPWITILNFANAASAKTL
jgi:hypothetical protein